MQPVGMLYAATNIFLNVLLSQFRNAAGNSAENGDPAKAFCVTPTLLRDVILPAFTFDNDFLSHHLEILGHRGFREPNILRDLL